MLLTSGWLFKRILPVSILALASLPAHAVTYSGRAMTGGFISLETFTDPSESVLSNNASTVSSRLFVNFDGLTDSNFKAVVDLRDKNDFFEKLDAEKLKLVPGNNFQLYQLYARSAGDTEGLYGAVGRFALSEAGGRFTDGAEAGYRWSHDWRTSVFGGLNPKREDQTYVMTNPNAEIAGAFTTFQPNIGSVAENAYWSTAVVGELTSGFVDRLYWYNNAIYAWDSPNQVFATVFLDFKPRVEVQTGLLSAHQALSSWLAADASLTAVDVIEYSRRRNFFETLDSSPYREGALNLRATIGDGSFWDTTGTYGYRGLDHLYKAEAGMGPAFYKLAGNHVSLKALGGGRHNFTGNDVFTRFVSGYYDSSWELDLSSSYTLSQDSGPTLHEWNNEVSLTGYFTRDLIGTASFEGAWDERITIWTASIKLSYAFGQRGLAPVPNVAPPPPPPLPAGRL